MITMIILNLIWNWNHSRDSTMGGCDERTTGLGYGKNFFHTIIKYYFGWGMEVLPCMVP
jgi:hypothetical protein